jgi:hypothetical protein
MPRNLEPNQIALPIQLSRGAIVSLPDPSAGPTAKQVAEILRFQYNPETVTRTRTGQWEHRLDKKGKLNSEQQKREMDNHRGGGLKSKSEMISMKLIFDATELMMRGGDQSDLILTGVLPELAVLERIALGPDQVPEPKKDESEFPLISLNPSEILFVLGPRRFPAVITSLNIVEQRYNPALVPVRAEVEVRLRVLEATKSATNTLIATAFEELLADRQRSAAAAAEIVRGDLQAAIVAAFDPKKVPTGGKT